MGQVRLKVRIAKDQLRAEVTVGAGEPVTEQELAEFLEREGVTHGIDGQVLTDLGSKLADPSYSAEKLVVARGDPGEPGRDGGLILDFSYGLAAGKRRADGSMDLRERSLVVSVAEGDLLATYRPPTQGKPGRTVKGQPIHHPAGTDCLPTFGPGARYDKGRATAAITGVVSYVEDESLDIVTIVTHEGDVDYESGNLRANGSVLVKGNLEPTFSVTATDDAYFEGDHCSGSIHAGGNVVIKGGVTAEEGDEIHAGGNITCHHAQGAVLHSGGTIEIEDHCVSSVLYARRVSLQHGRGKLLGGEVHARESIRVVEAGAAQGTPTLLSVAEMPKEPKRTSTKGKDPPIKGPKKLSTEAEAALLAKAQIVVEHTGHPGVQIHFGPYKRLIHEQIGSARFTWDAEERSIAMQ